MVDSQYVFTEYRLFYRISSLLQNIVSFTKEPYKRDDILQMVDSQYDFTHVICRLQHTMLQCVLQCVAVCCSVMQCVAV